MGHPATGRQPSGDRTHPAESDDEACLDERAVLDQLEPGSSRESSPAATGVVIGAIIGSALWMLVLLAFTVYFFFVI